MMTKRKTLGKNLSALLTNTDIQANASHSEGLQQLPVEWLAKGQYQPRQVFDDEALAQLAQSIKQQGIIQPIVVRQLAKQQYEIIAGERRWRAAQLAGLRDVPVIVQAMNDETALAVALVENIQREDLNAMERANALQRLLDEFALTQQELADMVGMSRTSVTNFLRLPQLQEPVKQLLARGELEMGHAKVLLAVTGQRQIQLAQQVAARGLTVRATEKLVRQEATSTQLPQQATRMRDPNIVQVEQQISEQLNAKTDLIHQSSGKGKVVIHYHSLAELDGLLQKFTGKKN
jgi:ParB family transcriptional regulator, chromosome partitioning protein